MTFEEIPAWVSAKKICTNWLEAENYVQPFDHEQKSGLHLKMPLFHQRVWEKGKVFPTGARHL